MSKKSDNVDTVNYKEAVTLALHDALDADPTVFLLGEDIADQEGGGVWKVTPGLSTKFGLERVRSTPIAEEGFIGAAIGAAQAGMRPVAELMIMSFLGCAVDVIHNVAAKWRYMTAGQASVPITITTFVPTGIGMAAQHSDSLEIWLASSPGVKVVQPSGPLEAYELLTASIFDDDPVVYVVPTNLMYRPTRVPKPQPGTRVDIGKAHVTRVGSDVSVIGYGTPIADALAVADRLAEDGIDAEIVDLRTIAPFDSDAIMRSVSKTKRAVVVHEARTNFGPSAEIAARIYEELFGELEAPIQRVGAPFTSVPSSPVLEAEFIPGSSDVEAAIRKAIDA